MAQTGAVAAGHPLTVETALEVLKAGGNAFDAAIAAHFTACVAEPVLASLGGGGFLLAQPATQKCRVFDFFVQTPQRKLGSAEIDFSPIAADFGAATQEFHIGQGAVATPGSVKGLFEIHARLGSMPMRELVAPAVSYARAGVAVNAFQRYIFEIVSPILRATPAASAIYCRGTDEGLPAVGDRLCFPELADSLEALAREGEELFYQGEIARRIVGQSLGNGGHLRRQDLLSYRVITSEPLRFKYRGCELLTNPPPSSGGILIAFALQLWERLVDLPLDYGEYRHLALLAEIMAITNQARIDAHLNGQGVLSAAHLLDDAMLERYRAQVLGRARAPRGTTHISVIDRCYNVASMTVSNGEGCGNIVPGTGIMLNNMLGEEDLNPEGFHTWKENQRMTSMMAPTIINSPDGALWALGSGGSNRIRTALLQTIINLVDFGLSMGEAIASPRLHYENGLLNLEAGYATGSMRQLLARYTAYKQWGEANLFFGGVHGVMERNGEFLAVGDARRGGAGDII